MGGRPPSGWLKCGHGKVGTVSGWTRLTDLLRRRTASTAFIPQIDGLRFYAVLAVLLFHCSGYLSTPARNPGAADAAATWIAGLSRSGHCGVELFFVISGFVLGLPFARAAAAVGPGVSLRRYFLRRVTRLEPPYIINLLVISAVLLALGRETLAALAPHLLASLAYCHNLVYGRSSTINFVAWSLEIEVQFYILAPLLARVFSLRTPGARALTLGAGVALASTLACHLTLTEGIPQPWKLTLACYLQYFLVGFALADWYARGGDRGDRSLLADALAIPCIAAVPLLEQHPVARGYLLPLACGGLCLSALHGRHHSRLMAVPTLVVIGGMCYTIYLYHPFIKSAIGPLVVRMAAADLPAPVLVFMQLAAFITAIVVVCVPLFLCFEKPFMAVGVRRTPRPDPHAAASS